MILGVSHIVLGSTNLSRDRSVLESYGWKTLFEEPNIPTFPGKRPFMSTKSNKQTMAFLLPAQGIPVELIHYSDIIPDSSPSPLKICLPSSHSASETGLFTCDLEFSSSAPLPSLVTHFVTDLEKAETFWTKGLGFRRTSRQDVPPETLELEFLSPVPHWRITLLLSLRKGVSTPNLLDGNGYRCLSFVCADLDRVRPNLITAGARRSSGCIDLKVNGKMLQLELFAGPDGVMIELFKTLKS
jgi:catechol 2,3-dioxygenase-like lactoylglutathione lyase family enzyme